MSSPVDPLNVYDLTGMSGPDARQYVISVGAHLKLTRDRLAALQKDLSLWQARTDLAMQKGMAELQSQAFAKVVELKAMQTAVEVEIMEIEQGMERMTAQLRSPSFAVQRGVDSEALLAQLESLVGPVDTVTPALKKSEADMALDALKKKLDPNYQPPSSRQMDQAPVQPDQSPAPAPPPGNDQATAQPPASANEPAPPSDPEK